MISEIRNIVRSVLKEYIIKDMVYLKDYFEMTDDMKKQSLPFSYYWFFEDFLKDEGIEFEHEEENLDLIYWLDTHNRELFDKYAEYLYKKIINGKLDVRDEEYPAWYFFSDNPQILKNQWLIHFTKHGEDIAKDGFKYGVSEVDKLGLTAYIGDFEKKYGGYNFAYTLDDMKKYAKVRKGLYKYGEGAVLFRASGIRIYHNIDREPQVIFYGNTAKDIIPIFYEYGDWIIKNKKTGKSIIKNEELDEVVDWAVNNYPQYKNSI